MDYGDTLYAIEDMLGADKYLFCTSAAAELGDASVWGVQAAKKQILVIIDPD